jgi:hypothetical protein
MERSVQLEGLGMILMPQTTCSPSAYAPLFTAANWTAAAVRKHRTRAGFPSEELTG